MKLSFLICLLFVLHGMAESQIRVYNYVLQPMDWPTAQSYCRQKYLDLATITTEEENERAVNVIGQSYVYTWIGLNRTVPHVNNWQWSGGEMVNYTNWHSGEPNDCLQKENCASLKSDGWYDNICQNYFPFICYWNLTLLMEHKTWENAFQYCRSNSSDLVIVDSKTMLDLLKAMTKQVQTASVWTGLRFLHGTWLWVNGKPLGSLVSLPSCPVEPYRCGAYNINTYVWENRDCNEELNFLCYP